MPFDSAPHGSLCRLSEAGPGARMRIAAIAAGSQIERRLCEMGLPRGTELVVVGRLGRRGAIIVSAHDSRMAIGADMAEAITVAPILS